MCEDCKSIRLYDYFNSPQDYLECIKYLQELVTSDSFELLSDSVALDKIKDEQGCWVDDIICHVIRCKKCGQRYTCGVNTFRGGGSFKKGM